MSVLDVITKELVNARRDRPRLFNGESVVAQVIERGDVADVFSMGSNQAIARLNARLVEHGHDIEVTGMAISSTCAVLVFAKPRFVKKA